MLELRLPNAIRDAEGTWTKKVIIDEMEGDEEDILTDQTRDTGGTGTYAVSGPERITKILSRCTVQIGEKMKRPAGRDRYDLPDFFDKVWDLGFSTDRVFAMVRLRQLSLGPIYQFDRNCPSCKREIKGITINLAQLEVVDKPLEYVSLLNHEIELPKSRDRVTWKFLQGIDEPFVEQVMRDHQQDFLSVIMWRRIQKVSQMDPELGQYNSPTDPPGGLLYTKRMKSGDRRFLTSACDAGEGGIDTEFQIICDNPQCRIEFTSKLQVMGGDFFFPSETPSLGSSTNAPLPSAGGTHRELSPASPSQNEPV